MAAVLVSLNHSPFTIPHSPPLLNIAVPHPLGPIPQEPIAEPVPEQGDDPVLRGAFRLGDDRGHAFGACTFQAPPLAGPRRAMKFRAWKYRRMFSTAVSRIPSSGANCRAVTLGFLGMARSIAARFPPNFSPNPDAPAAGQTQSPLTTPNAPGGSGVWEPGRPGRPP